MVLNVITSPYIYVQNVYIKSSNIYIYCLVQYLFLKNYGFSSHINICFVCIVIIIIIVLDILSYFHIAHLTTEIKYKIAQSTSFMLCMSYRYIYKSSPLFLSNPLIFCYFWIMVCNATFTNIAFIS